MSGSDLERLCARHLSWHPPSSPADRLLQAAAYARIEKIDADRYGQGAFLSRFEAEMAAALGQPAALFFASGGSAQLVATRVWAEHDRDRRLTLHPRSHVELREGRGYARVNGLEARFAGREAAPLEPSDLSGLGGGTLLVELPLRALGGALPSWEAQGAIVDWARETHTRLHLDGARIFEAAAAYGRELAEVAGGADSVYVSFYKGIGSTTGALLAGPQDFIDEASEWRDRFGARMVELYPFAIPARQNLALRRDRFPAYHARAREIASALAALEGVTVFPNPPHTNMFHVYFQEPAERLEAARDEVARERDLWLCGFFARGLDIGACYAEVVIGDAADALETAEIVDAFADLLERADRAR